MLYVLQGDVIAKSDHNLFHLKKLHIQFKGYLVVKELKINTVLFRLYSRVKTSSK